MSTELKQEIIKLIKDNKNRGFLYLQEGDGEIKIKGEFSDMDALNFVTTLVQERPVIRRRVANFIKNYSESEQE